MVLGGQVAWVESGGGNKLELQLKAATLARKATYDLAFASNGHGAEGSWSGDWIRNLRGQGGLLVYGWFEICEVLHEVDDCYGEEPTPGFQDWRVLAPGLRRVAGLQQRAIRKSVDSLVPVAVDDGLIALAPILSKDPILVVDGTGAVKARIEVPEAPHVDMTATVSHAPYALDNRALFVLRAAAIESYSVNTGALLRKTPLPAAATGGKLAGTAGGIVAVLQQGVVSAVVRAGGKSIRIAAPQGARKPGIVDAWITPAGLFYAYNVPSATSHGRVAFLPLAKVKARF